MGIAVSDALFHLPGVGGAQMGHEAALAPDKVHHLFLCVLTGITQAHHRLKAGTAEALRREHPLVVPDAVYHFAADEQAGGGAAAQMQHDEAAILQRSVQHLLGAAAGHGAAVQGVAQHGTPDLRQAGEPGLLHHLVHRHRVADERRDLQGLRQLQRQHTPQVGGVGGVLHGVHVVRHGLIHQIGAGLAGRQLPAPGADAVQLRRVEAVGGQRPLNDGAAEVHLLHDPVEGGQLLPAVAQRFVKDLFLPAEHRDLGGGGAGVDDQNAFTHRCIGRTQGIRRSFPDKFRETGAFADMGVFCYSIKDSLLPRKQKSFRRP